MYTFERKSNFRGEKPWFSGPPISVLAFGVDLYLARGRFVVRGVVLHSGKKSGVVLQFSPRFPGFAFYQKKKKIEKCFGTSVLLRRRSRIHDKSFDVICLSVVNQKQKKGYKTLRLPSTMERQAFHSHNDETFVDACNHGNLETAQNLLKKGAAMNSVDGYQQTGLFWASHKGHLDIVKWLLSIGADMEICSQYGESPLFWAATNGRLEIMKELVKAGANKNKGNNDGTTALHRAVASAPYECAAYLVDAGANYNQQDNSGVTALDFAIKLGKMEIVTLLKMKELPLGK